VTQRLFLIFSPKERVVPDLLVSTWVCKAFLEPRCRAFWISSSYKEEERSQRGNREEVRRRKKREGKDKRHE
jgi:hypothetical protein